MKSSSSYSPEQPPASQRPSSPEHPHQGRPPGRRIVHVLTRFLRAGAEENTVASCCHQAERGHTVFLIHGEEFDAEYAQELNPAITRIHLPQLVHPIRPWQDIKGLRALREVYRQVAPDLVHTHQSKAGILGRLAAIRRPLAVVHTVHIAHFMNVGWLREKVFVAIERFCSRFTHYTISVSAGVRRACLERGISDADRHLVIHSGMDTRRFAQARPPSDWRDVIEQWPRDQKPFTVLMLAAFEPRKRHESMLRALAPLLAREPDLCFVMCGQGARQAAAKALVKELGIDHQVRFIGYIPGAERYVAAADLCVLTSEREGLPRVLVQYVAAGKPVVANDLPGIEAIVKDGVTGVVLPADDMAGVIDHIQRLMNDRTALQQLADNAAKVDVSSWNVDRMGTQIEVVYERALLLSQGQITPGDALPPLEQVPEPLQGPPNGTTRPLSTVGPFRPEPNVVETIK